MDFFYNASEPSNASEELPGDGNETDELDGNMSHWRLVGHDSQRNVLRVLGCPGGLMMDAGTAAAAQVCLSLEKRGTSR